MTPDLSDRFVTILERTSKRLVNDLLAVPADKRGIAPGGVAKTPLAMVAECGVINSRIALAIRGLPLPPRMGHEEQEAYLATFGDADAALGFLRSATEDLMAAIREIAPESWDDTVALFPGRPGMTRWDAVVLAAGHMQYHDGQLNLIHMLNGDGEIHWT